MSLEEIKDKALNILPDRFNILNLCVLYRYLSIKGQLCSRGYDLSSIDRELVFIEIITKNDPEEISILEKYLEVYDLVQENTSLLKTYEKFFKDLETSEDTSSSLNAFLKNFN